MKKNKKPYKQATVYTANHAIRGFFNSRIVTLIIWVLVLAALVAWSIWWLYKPQTLPFNQVRMVASYQHLSKLELQQTVQKNIDGGFFSLNIEHLQQQLETLPWVERATIRRLWPAVLWVKISEKQAVAQWGKDQLLSSTGRLFQPALANFPSNLPQLSGTNNELIPVWQRFVKYNQKLRPFDVEIVDFGLDARQAWFIVLSNQLRIDLGKTDIDHRFDRFIEAYPQVLAEKSQPIRSIDMRYPHGMAVRW